jgi:DNA replication and repair protein RecF
VSLAQLSIERLRCIESAKLELHGSYNLISGDNASGKTSLLEAFFLLGRGRSFRARRTEALIRHGAGDLVVSGRVTTATRQRPVGVRVSKEGLEARIDGRPAGGLAELATVLPVQAIDPEIHRLIEDGPQERRRYLDWGVFHVEPGFVDEWRRYQRALKQRNAALRAGQAQNLVRAWDGELIEAGTAVAERRRAYLERLRPFVRVVGRRLLDLDVELSLAEGWAQGRSLAEALELGWPRDVERGLTHAGPHRADLGVRVQAHLARGLVSRGQQKLLAAALILGQLQANAESGSSLAALLVDDPAAELDVDNLCRLLEAIKDVPAQLLVTALDPSSVAQLDVATGHRFHVEHGKVTRLL